MQNLEFGIEVIEDFSYSDVPILEKKGRSYDFVFIDGNPCMDFILIDVLVTNRVLKVGGILAIDDSTDFAVKFEVELNPENLEA
ncbi:hypothetical protein ACFLZM_06260 [Thermodesulfobacteriota bacterium]